MITIYSGIINIILNLIFIPIYGIIAAAITTSISFFLTYVFAVYYSRNIKNKVLLENKRIHIFAIYLLVVVIFSSWFNGNETDIFYLNLAIKLAIIIFGCYMGAKMGIFATLKKIFEHGKKNFVF